MKREKYETVFGGVHAAASGSVPGWYRAVKSATHGATADFPHLREAARTLADRYGASMTEAYYYDEERGEYVEVPERGVVVNPAWLGDGLDDSPKASAGWTTASAEYEPITAEDAYWPLADVAAEAGFYEAFGSVETYRNGGEVVVEVLFDDLRFEDPDSGVEFVLGFESGFDHYRRSSVWATLLAYDTETGAALRGLSERYSRAHRGDSVRGDLREWFRSMLGRAERLDDTLTQVVAEAQNYTVPMSDIPLGVAEFYEAQGFPGSYGSRAAERLHDTRRPTAFELYLAMAETVTTEFNGKKGGQALRDHASRTNELLFSPPSAEKTALAAALTDRIESLDEGVAAFESMRERFRAMLDGLEDEPDEGESEAEAEADEVAA